MKTLSLYLLILLLLPFSLAGSEASGKELMSEATRAIEQGDYQKAIEIYDQLEAESVYSKALFVNRSLAHYKNSELVLSVYYLEKARKLYPFDETILNALSDVKLEAGIDIIEVPDFFLNVLWKRLSLSLSPGTWFFIQIASGLLFLYLLYKWQSGQESLVKLRDFARSLTVFFVFLIALALGYSADSFYHDDTHALVMQPEVLYGGADERSDALRDLVPGTHVEVLDSVTDWKKVILENKEEGWIKSEILRGI